MSRAAVSCPVARLSAFYATIFLVTGIRLPFWPVWLVSRGLDGTIGSDADWRYRYPRCRALGCPRLRADSALGLGQLYPRLARWRHRARFHFGGGCALAGSRRLCASDARAPRCSAAEAADPRLEPVCGYARLRRQSKVLGFVVGASALQPSHQIYYGFGTLYWRPLGFSETTIGMLWAEGTVAGILLFWHGQRLLARFGPEGLMMIGGAAGIIRWILSGRLTWLPSIVVLQPLHAFTFGASYLGAMHFLSRATPFSAAGSLWCWRVRFTQITEEWLISSWPSSPQPGY